MNLAERMKNLGTETAFAVLAKALALEAQGRSIIHLEIGEPDFGTPDHVTEAAITSLKAGRTRYCPSAGIPALRKAISAHIGQTRDIEVNPERVVVTPGAKPILFFSMLAVVNPGEEVMYPDPGFPIYESVARFAGAIPVPIPLREEDGFSLDIDMVERLMGPQTRLVIINSPHNPTGGVMSKEDLARLAELCVKNDCMVLSDEVYSSIVYDGPHRSIVSLPGMVDRVILVDGFSKTFAMTGWRLGYAVAPEYIATAVTELMINSCSCTPPFIQDAGVAALSGSMEPTARMVDEFRRRRDIVVSRLNSIPGVSCVMPKGAFYAFPNIKATGLDCHTLSDYLLDHGGVAVLPGTCFGKWGDGHIRISFANSENNIRQALDIFEECVVKLAQAG
ncbi:MAG: pyridoxal phosphate-dependent aminotransferase [Bacillota bacterium]